METKLPNMRCARQYPIDRVGGLFVLAQFLFFIITRCGRPMQLEGATAKGRLEYTLDTLDTIVSTTIVILILKVEQKVRQKGTDGFQYI